MMYFGTFLLQKTQKAIYSYTVPGTVPHKTLLYFFWLHVTVQYSQKYVLQYEIQTQHLNYSTTVHRYVNQLPTCDSPTLLIFLAASSQRVTYFHNACTFRLHLSKRSYYLFILPIFFSSPHLSIFQQPPLSKFCVVFDEVHDSPQTKARDAMIPTPTRSEIATSKNRKSTRETPQKVFSLSRR